MKFPILFLFMLHLVSSFVLFPSNNVDNGERMESEIQDLIERMEEKVRESAQESSISSSFQATGKFHWKTAKYLENDDPKILPTILKFQKSLTFMCDAADSSCQSPFYLKGHDDSTFTPQFPLFYHRKGEFRILVDLEQAPFVELSQLIFSNEWLEFETDIISEEPLNLPQTPATLSFIV